MADRFRMEDGAVVSADNASAQWYEATEWDGQNHIGKSTGSQWEHQTLFRSRKGRFWLLHNSQWQGSRPHAEWLDEHEAVRWLLVNDHEVPEDVAHLVDAIEE